MDITPKKATPPTSSSQPSSATNVGIVIAAVVGAIIGFLFSYGAARLSYNAYGSYGWSFLAFIFSGFYYPYYAFFVSKPASFFGGKRR